MIFLIYILSFICFDYLFNKILKMLMSSVIIIVFYTTNKRMEYFNILLGFSQSARYRLNSPSPLLWIGWSGDSFSRRPYLSLRILPHQQHQASYCSPLLVRLLERCWSLHRCPRLRLVILWRHQDIHDRCRAAWRMVSPGVGPQTWHCYHHHTTRGVF